MESPGGARGVATRYRPEGGLSSLVGHESAVIMRTSIIEPTVGVAYMDHAASTPMRPEAFEAMVPFLQGNMANPTGTHRPARLARQAIDEARDVVAESLGVRPGEVVFVGTGI